MPETHRPARPLAPSEQESTTPAAYQRPNGATLTPKKHFPMQVEISSAVIKIVFDSD